MQYPTNPPENPPSFDPDLFIKTSYWLVFTLVNQILTIPTINFWILRFDLILKLNAEVRIIVDVKTLRTQKYRDTIDRPLYDG